MVKHRCACTFPPSPLLPLSVLMLHAGQQYQLGLSCHHPIEGYHPSPLLRLAGAAHRSSLGCHSHLASLDHTLCLILIGLARPKKVPATVKLCLRGGDCEAKCLRSFSHGKCYHVSFRFTPKLSDQVVVITEESDFYTRYCRNKLHDSKKGKNGDLQICRYSNSCRYSRCR